MQYITLVTIAAAAPYNIKFAANAGTARDLQAGSEKDGTAAKLVMMVKYILYPLKLVEKETK